MNLAQRSRGQSRLSSMEIRDFFARLLDLVRPWTVQTVVWEDRADIVEVYVECADALQLHCPSCDRLCPVTGLSPSRRWRHADTCLKKTFVLAAPPVVNCPEHGKQPCRVPWEGAVSGSLAGEDIDRVHGGLLMTKEFEKWILGLTRTFRDLKKAAGFAGVDYAVVRRLLRSDSRETQQTGTAERASFGPEDHQLQGAQLSLFAQSDMRFLNRGIHAFGNLELGEALELFKKHRVHYPKGFDVSSRLKVTEFLLEGLRDLPAEPFERPGYLCTLWDSFEDYSKADGADCAAFAARAKNAYFAYVLQEMERSGVVESTVLPENRPAGFVLLQAGRYEEAIRSLQEHVLRMPQSAALYGWLGDAYLLRGDHAVARQCYREACFLDPSAIDWRHLEDAELKQLKQDILFEYDSDPELAVEWLPSHACIEGLFEPEAVRVNEGLKELVESYLVVEKQWRKEKSPRLAARLFARGIVLCENGENLKFIRKIDLIQVRRMMKQANPDLFEEFLRKI